MINPRIVESDGEWAFEEGCLSVPGLSWEIVRPNAVHLVGLDLDGNEVSIEATELEGRVFQHELDHLDGILLVERLNEDQRKEALKILRTRALDLAPGDPDGLVGPLPRLRAPGPGLTAASGAHVPRCRHGSSAYGVTRVAPGLPRYTADGGPAIARPRRRGTRRRAVRHPS